MWLLRISHYHLSKSNWEQAAKFSKEMYLLANEVEDTSIKEQYQMLFALQRTTITVKQTSDLYVDSKAT